MRDDFLCQQLHRAADGFRLHSTEVEPENEMPVIDTSLILLNQVDQIAGCAKQQLVAFFKLKHFVTNMTASIVVLVVKVALQGISTLLLSLIACCGYAGIKDEWEFVLVGIASCCQVVLVVGFHQLRQRLQAISCQMGQINNGLSGATSHDKRLSTHD